MSSPIHPAIASGKVAVITGGASGIGLAAARRFAMAGMDVCVIDCAGDVPDTAYPKGGGRVLSFRADVSDRLALSRVADEITERFGPPAVLMNNAGIGGGGDALSNPEGWEKVLGINLLGVLHGVQCFVPGMIESGAPGLVITTGSKQGITTPPGDTAYNVSKAGVKVLTEGLEHTLREQTDGRVRAHLLIPGFTYTDMIARRIPRQPPTAWSAEQVVDRMMDGLAQNEFYILCEDNETTPEQDERRILWAAGDIVQRRPALSRWHPDWKDAFARFEEQGK
jgi:NAD(P)-dependent dehydrogenase (short-subunit alcohol dehydrogenase family)